MCGVKPYKMCDGNSLRLFSLREALFHIFRALRDPAFYYFGDKAKAVAQ